VSEVLPLMAAFEDKTRPAAPVSEAAPSKTLVVRGVIVMGGIVGAGVGSLYGLNENQKQDQRYRDAYARCMHARGHAG